jgi:peptidyl-tRNA hydrolase
MKNEVAPEIDFILFGLGEPVPELVVSRINAGFIFSDYLLNCINMQNLLIEKARTTNVPINMNDATIIPPDFKRPEYIRSRALAGAITNSADYKITDFLITQSDLNGSSDSAEAQANVVVLHLIRRQSRLSLSSH